LDRGVDHLGWATSTLMQNLGSAATFAVVLPLLRRRGAPRGFGRLFITPPIVLAGLIVLLGDVSFNVGLSTSADAGATVVIAISACYPALTILLALRHFGEEVRAVPLGGAVAAILGVVALTAT
jgi:drug/metabolite transporter (DMT)-like permease